MCSSFAITKKICKIFKPTATVEMYDAVKIERRNFELLKYSITFLE